MFENDKLAHWYSLGKISFALIYYSFWCIFLFDDLYYVYTTYIDIQIWHAIDFLSKVWLQWNSVKWNKINVLSLSFLLYAPKLKLEVKHMDEKELRRVLSHRFFFFFIPHSPYFIPSGQYPSCKITQ